MKKLISLMAILAIIFASNCSRIPENNDPVIGIWSRVETQDISAVGKQTVREEWIFNDAYLGRYHRYNGAGLEIKTDFGWEQEDGIYTIKYPGLDVPNHYVSMEETAEGVMLQERDGNVLAHRE